MRVFGLSTCARPPHSAVAAWRDLEVLSGLWLACCDMSRDQAVGACVALLFTLLCELMLLMLLLQG